MHHTELQSRRRSLGLSQDALAKRLGVATNTLARWERGELRIQHPEMLRWALEAIDDDLASLSPEDQHKRNLESLAQATREAAEREAQATPEERAAAERWFGKH